MSIVKGVDHSVTHFGTELPDTQNSEDTRGVEINRVGLSEFNFPMMVERPDGTVEKVKAEMSMYGSLVHSVKGTNPSRFVEVIEEYSGKAILGLANFPELLARLKQSVEAEDVYVSAEFDYWLPMPAPVTKKYAVAYYKASYTGLLDRTGVYRLIQGVKVAVAAVCPCSKKLAMVDPIKEIGYGAHNQRGNVALQVQWSEGSQPASIETLVRAVEDSGSVPLYPLLKRADEKYVTEEGYKNPKFVEDIVRDTALKVRNMPGAEWFRVKCANDESIHPHQVTAYVEQTLNKANKEWELSGRGFF